MEGSHKYFQSQCSSLRIVGLYEGMGCEPSERTRLQSTASYERPQNVLVLWSAIKY